MIPLLQYIKKAIGHCTRTSSKTNWKRKKYANRKYLWRQIICQYNIVFVVSESGQFWRCRI